MDVDFTGDRKTDLTADIEGGVGQANIRLPKNVGVIAHASGGIGSIDVRGLKHDGDSYTNDAYGKSTATIHLKVEGGIGEMVVARTRDFEEQAVWAARIERPAAADGRIQPLLGVFPPAAAGALRRGALAGEPMRTLVQRMDPVLVDLPEAALRSVNTPAELAEAEAELRQVRSSR